MGLKEARFLTLEDLKAFALKFKRDTELFTGSDWANQYKDKLSYPQLEEKWFEEFMKGLGTSRTTGGILKNEKWKTID